MAGRSTDASFGFNGSSGAFHSSAAPFFPPHCPWKSGYLKYVQIPAGVILIDAALAFLGVSGMRIIRRLLGEKADMGRHAESLSPAKERIPTLLVGAGQAGVMVARELASHADIGIEPVGFLDDDPSKMGTSIHGVLVRGQLKDLEKVVSELGVRQVLITIAAAPGQVIRGISEACERAGTAMKIIPGLSEIVIDKVSITRIRDVTIEDLLRRAPVKLDEDLIGQELRGTTALVTGAGGSIGSELCRQLCHAGVSRLVLVEQAENALYEIHSSLVQTFPGVAIEPCIADVCDVPRLDALFARFRPDHVFHAAAHKH